MSKKMESQKVESSQMALRELKEMADSRN